MRWGNITFPLCYDANTIKDDADLGYGRHEPVYTEMELLDIYRDLLNAQAQIPESVGSAADEFEEQERDRTSVHAFVQRLNEHSPPKPGTSKSHAGVDLRGPISRCQGAVSQLAAMIEDMDTTMENPDHPPSQFKADQQILPPPSEWASFIRECVSAF